MAGKRLTTSKGAYSRMVLNQAKFTELDNVVAAGLFEAGKQIIEAFSQLAADSPLDPYPTGEGLPKQGGVLVYIGNQKTHGWSMRGDQPVKPRSARVTTKEHSVVALVGVGFPGRFNEVGTVNMPAHPALTPARDRVAPQILDIVAKSVGPEVAKS